MTIIGVIGFALPNMSLQAQAGQGISAYGYYTVNGVDWRNYAVINTDPSNNHQAYGVTLVSPRNKGVGGGWAGAAPRTFRNGALVCSGSYAYNPNPLARYQEFNPSGCDQYGVIATYYSIGVTQAWTGSGYTAYWTFQTPNANS